MKYYIDKQLMDIVSEEDIDLTTRQPDSYYEYVRGTSEDIIIETHQCTTDLRILFAYTPVRDAEDRKHLELNRQMQFRHHKAEPLYLSKFSVPAIWYDEMIVLYEGLSTGNSILKAVLPPDWYDSMVDINDMSRLLD